MKISNFFKKSRPTHFFVVVFVILSIIAINFLFRGKNQKITLPISAATGSVTITDQAEWTSGSNVNTKLNDPAGTVKIDSLLIGDMVFGSAGNATYNGVYTESGTYDSHPAYTNGTRWLYWTGGPVFWWALGETLGAAAYYRSGWVDPSTNPWSEAPPFPPEGTPFPDVTAYSKATHTSTTTQLDAGSHGSMNWTTFVPSGTIPANTSINFRFRTSADAATWGSWTASTAYGASIDIETLLGATDAAKRYLQVETTLANTDGASTPTLDAYTANYEYVVLDHVTISPDDANLTPGQTQTYTGTAYDDSSAVMTGVTWAWSATGGTITSGGVYTAGSTSGDYVITGSVTYDGVTKTDTAPVHISDSGCNVRIFPKNCPQGQSTGCPEGPGYFLAILPYYWWDYSVTTTTNSGAVRDDVTYSWSFDNWAGWTLTPSADGKSSIIRVGSEWNPQAGWFGGSVNVSASCGGSDTSNYYTYYGSTDDGGGGEKNCSLSISPVVASLFVNGDPRKQTFTVEAKNKNGTILKGKKISWTTTGGELTPQGAKGGTAEFQAMNRGHFDVQASAPGCNSATALVNVGELYCIGNKCAKGDPDYKVTLEPESAEIASGATAVFTAHTYDKDNNNLDSVSTFSFDISAGGNIVKQNNNKLIIKAGDETGKFTDAVSVSATRGADVAIDTSSFDVTKEPPICIGTVCLPPETFCIGDTCIVVGPNAIIAAVDAIAVAVIALIVLLLSAAGNALTMLTPAEVVNQVVTTTSNAISRFFGIFTKGKGQKKARVGLVYDADTGLAIPMAKTLLFRARDNKLISTTVSDSQGRFAIETPPGEEYFLEVKKTGFAMLAKNFNLLSKKTLAYKNNYFGDHFRPVESNTVFSGAIPLRYAPDANKLIKNAFRVEKFAKIFRLLNVPILLVGFIFSLFALKMTNSWFNWLVFYLYIVIFVYYIIQYLTRGRTFGLVVKTADSLPVDLAVVRAFSETNGKLVKTSVSNLAGHYNLALPKGYYKLLVEKPSLEQTDPLAIRVKSAFTPRKEKIGMREVSRENVETRMMNDLPAGRHGEQISNVPARNASGIADAGGQISNQNQAENRMFGDSKEIVDNYRGKNKKYGTVDLANLGVHHLINQRIENEEDLEDLEDKEDKENNDLIDNQSKEPEHPNWKFPSPGSPM